MEFFVGDIEEEKIDIDKGYLNVKPHISVQVLFNFYNVKFNFT